MFKEKPTGTPDVFWGELAPCEHLLQIYADDEGFLAALEPFVAAGLASGESVILIATPSHLGSLERRLRARGFDLEAAEADDQYIALDAETTLSRFMVDGWPVDERFQNVVAEVLARAKSGGRRVRAFGEMVALLWANGHCGATVRLEHLWQELCRQQEFSVFCAYPKAGFTADSNASLQAICSQHSRMVPG